MKSSSRLRVGLTGLGLLIVICVLGPWVTPAPPAADPARAALLPPGTGVTEVTLDNGRTLVSPEVEVGDRLIVVHGPHRNVELSPENVVRVKKSRFLLGSDRMGRDVLGRVMAGGRFSLAIAALAAMIALLVGSSVGLAAATGGPVTDSALMRFVDALMAFPLLFLLILVATLFRPGPAVLVAVLGLTSWMGLARLVRGQVLAMKGRPFILAAQAAGSSKTFTWRRHYLPNLAGPLSQDTALRLGDLVLAEAALSYLGVGVSPDLPTWGGMVAQGHRVMVDGWWLATFPGLAIATLVISLALIGDGVQERLMRGVRA